jgi:hypothetical protein
MDRKEKQERKEEKLLEEARAGEPRPQPVGDAAGAIVGTAAGASIGILAGPLGAMVGAAAGALGGWWAGHAVADQLQNYDEDEMRRAHRDLHPTRPYEDTRDLYKFGHLASSNPDYQGRPFEEIEKDLEKTWDGHAQAHYGPWGDVRDYVAEGFKRSED